VKPTARAVWLIGLTVPIALGVSLTEARLWPAWAAHVGAALLLLLADAALALPKKRLTVTAEAPDMLFIGDADPLPITITTRGWKRGATLEVLVDFEGELSAQPLARARLDDAGEARITVPLAPRRRGSGVIQNIWLRWTGPLGLAGRALRVPLVETVRIVANTRAVRAAAIRFLNDPSFLSGLKTVNALDAGSEFDSLREYQPGLDRRHIDWKSSARHRKLLCREFRAERNHQVVLAFDTGHLMSEPLAGMPKLDHAINAGLLMAYFSLKTGDRVGLYGFDERVRAYAAPAAGVAAIHRLQRLSSDLDYTTCETNFTLGLAELSQRLTRRSLVVVMTDFADTVTAELMVENLDRLARRHLVVFVSLRDPALDTEAQLQPRSILDVGRAVVAGDLLREREVVLRRLRRQGVFCVDAPPAAVSVELLNRYLEIRRRELV
jgi:uncharacterized protein (DUF58 family)